MWVNHLPLWRNHGRGKFYDYTYLIDTSKSVFEHRTSLCSAVNRLIKLDHAISKHSGSENHFATILTFGAQLNVIRYMQPLNSAKIIYHPDWNMEPHTALYDALILAIEMAENRMGALAEAGRAEIKLTLFSDGNENSSKATWEDVKKVLERVKGCPSPWQLKTREDEEEDIEDFLGIPLDVKPRKLDVRDDYTPVNFEPFTSVDRARVRAIELEKMRKGISDNPFESGLSLGW